jgi:hypothetical protein
MDLAFVFLYLIGLALTLLVLYAIIFRAVVDALERHYKNVRWYEQTGEWAGKNPPRAFDAGPINKK